MRTRHRCRGLADDEMRKRRLLLVGRIQTRGRGRKLSKVHSLVHGVLLTDSCRWSRSLLRHHASTRVRVPGCLRVQTVTSARGVWGPPCTPACGVRPARPRPVPLSLLRVHAWQGRELVADREGVTWPMTRLLMSHEISVCGACDMPNMSGRKFK